MDNTAKAPTKNQQYHLIVADIAMAAAISTCDSGYKIAISAEDYVPGSVRDAWLGQVSNDLLRRQVTALANAGTASLQALEADRLAEMAERYGIPVSALAGDMAQHFTDKREAVLTYRR